MEPAKGEAPFDSLATTTWVVSNIEAPPQKWLVSLWFPLKTLPRRVHTDKPASFRSAAFGEIQSWAFGILRLCSPTPPSWAPGADLGLLWLETQGTFPARPTNGSKWKNGSFTCQKRVPFAVLRRSLPVQGKLQIWLCNVNTILPYDLRVNLYTPKGHNPPIRLI